MRAFKPIALSLVLALGIALAISVVGELDRNIVTPSGDPMVVFSDHRTRTLSQETIVDELVQLQLASRLDRVMVGSSRLEIDLLVKNPPIYEETVYADLASVTKLAFAQSDNISRIFIRVLKENQDNQGNVLLLAMTGAKSDFTAQELQRLRDGDRMPAAWLKEKMTWTLSEEWKELSI